MIFSCTGNSQPEAIFHPSPFLNALHPLVWIECRESKTTERQGEEEVRSSAREKKGVRGSDKPFFLKNNNKKKKQKGGDKLEYLRFLKASELIGTEYSITLTGLFCKILRFTVPG